MGVLDEAIRQHLELKRAHGASEEELERQEAEALGPARREPTAGDEETGEAGERPGGDGPAAEAPPAAASEASPPTAEPAAHEPAGGSGAAIDEPRSSDSEADEVPADEALEVSITAEPPADPGEKPGPGRVFDVEELGPPDEPAPGAAAPDTGVRPLREVPPLDDAEETEEALDAEEEAEEELADELAAGVSLSGAPEAAADPEPPLAGPNPADDERPLEEETILRPPPRAEAEAETDEYEVADEMLGDAPAASGSAVEGELVEEELLVEDELADDELLEEEDDMLEEEGELLEDEAEAELAVEERLEEGEDLLVAEEAGPPSDRHIAADEDLDAEDDLEAAEAGADEDMLEETPEFLHDAPEDERLWSEQSPPRDFDLDR